MALVEERPVPVEGEESGPAQGQFIAGTGFNDTLSGAAGDDVILGGGGDDKLVGNEGNDVIFGASSAGGSVDMDRFKIQADYTGTVTFQGESAGYRNVLGMYKIADDGSIYDVEVLFGNASLQGSGGNLVAGQSSVDVELRAGDQVGFFVVPNGYSRSGGDDSVFADGAGTFEFRNADGEPGNANGGAELQLVHIDEAGQETVVRSQYGNSVFHSMGGAEGGLNGDLYDHVTGEVDVETGSIRIGFEDLWNGGDKDFDDSVFTFDVGVTNAALLPRAGNSTGSNSDNDAISGGTGADELFGMRGDDTVDGGAGDDNIWGNSGDDLLRGGDGDDVVKGGSGNDVMIGGDGNDDMHGNSGDDMMSGNDGDDDMNGNSGDDLMFDGAGNDVVNGGSGNDVFIAGLGDDSYNGGSGFDTLSFGGAESGVNVDLHGHVVTGMGADKVQSVESIIGTDFDDSFKGDKRDNMLDGGAGDDEFRGLGGADTFTGGEGNDTYIWFNKDIVSDKTGEHLGVDVITDFEVGDVLQINDMQIDMNFDTHNGAFHMENTLEGAMVSVDIGGTFVDVVLLQGIQGAFGEEIVPDGDDAV